MSNKVERELQKVKLLQNIVKDITYWTGKNSEYAKAYIMFMNAFTQINAEEAVNNE